MTAPSSVAGFGDEADLDKDSPRVDGYDELDDEDERRLLDTSSHGTIGKQRLTPLPGISAAMKSKLENGNITSVYFHCIKLFIRFLSLIVVKKWLL